MTDKRGTINESETSDRERFYVAAVKSSHHAFLTTSPDGTITSWSPGAERLFGYTYDEAVGQSISLIVPPDRQHERVANGNRLRRLEHISNFETVRQHKNGYLVEVAFDASPILSDQGRLLGSSYIARDISEEKLARDLFHFAFDACPSGMIMTDAAGRIIIANPEVEQLFGYSRDELENQTIELLIPPARDRQSNGNGADDQNDNANTAMMPGSRNVSGRRGDGSCFAAEVRGNAIATPAGTLTLCSVIDVSERRRIEQRKDEFVSYVSHELRTPLTSIAGALALIVGGAAGQLPEPALRLIAIAHKNSERLIRLINDLLDVEKMESGKLQLDFKPCDAVELIEQAVEANRGFAGKFGVGFKVSAPPDPVLIRADADRFLQVITNLLSNAIKYSPPGNDVEVSVARHDDAVRVDVRDHGPGIPDELRPRLFEKFAQAEEPQKGGTGLGLSIVKQLVILHGGSIWVESPPDGGTSFCMELAPWNDADNDQTNAARRGPLDQVEHAPTAQQDNREVA